MKQPKLVNPGRVTEINRKRSNAVCKCGSERIFLYPAWYNDLVRPQWTCVARTCPFRKTKLSPQWTPKKPTPRRRSTRRAAILDPYD